MIYMKEATSCEPEGRPSPQSEKPPIGVLPDFPARMKEIFANKEFKVSGAELLAIEREDRV
jgi:hypothetical protein